MDQTEALVKTIVEGLQEKKGKNIVTVDLTQLSGSICQYMIICEGSTPLVPFVNIWLFVRETLLPKFLLYPIPYGISHARMQMRSLCLLTVHRALNGSAWIMARFLYIYSCRNNVHFITWRTFGQTRRLYKYLTLIKPV